LRLNHGRQGLDWFAWLGKYSGAGKLQYSVAIIQGGLLAFEVSGATSLGKTARGEGSDTRLVINSGFLHCYV